MQPDQVFEPGGLSQDESCLAPDPPDKVQFSRVEPKVSDADIIAIAGQRLEEMVTFDEDSTLIRWNMSEEDIHEEYFGTWKIELRNAHDVLFDFEIVLMPPCQLLQAFESLYKHDAETSEIVDWLTSEFDTV